MSSLTDRNLPTVLLCVLSTQHRLDGAVNKWGPHNSQDWWSAKLGAGTVLRAFPRVSHLILIMTLTSILISSRLYWWWNAGGEDTYPWMYEWKNEWNVRAPAFPRTPGNKPQPWEHSGPGHRPKFVAASTLGFLLAPVNSSLLEHIFN